MRPDHDLHDLHDPPARRDHRRTRGSAHRMRVLAAVITVAALGAPMTFGASIAAAQAANPPPAPAGSPADSTPNGKPPAGQPNSWALAPGGPNAGQPGERPYFTYDLAPGTTVEDSAVVFNYSDKDLVFNVYAQDAFNTRGGGLDILAAGQQSKDVGAWIALDNNKMVVPKHSGVTIPFKLDVPANALPGDHAAGIVASLDQPSVDQNGKQVIVDHRAGSRVYLRVTGAINPSMVIDDVQAIYTGTTNPFGKGGLDVTYTVKNTGNTRLRAHQSVAVLGLLGWTQQERALEDVPELLPGSSMTRMEHFDDVVPTMRVSAEVKIIPLAAAGKTDTLPESATRSSTVWAVPWTLLLLMVAIVVALHLVRRWRTSRRPAAGTGGSGSSRGRGGPSADDGGVPAGGRPTASATDADDDDFVVIPEDVEGADHAPREDDEPLLAPAGADSDAVRST